MRAIPVDDPRRGSRQRKGPTTKDRLVAVVASEMYGVSEVARAIGTTNTKLRRWRSEEELLPYLLAARSQIIGQVTEVSEKAWAETLKRVISAPGDIPTRDLLAIASEATNKMQLMSGQATSRSETRDVTDGIDDAEMQVIVDAARRHLERHGPSYRARMVEGSAVEVPAPPEPDTT
jgi:transposase-like protein